MNTAEKPTIISLQITVNYDKPVTERASGLRIKGGFNPSNHPITAGVGIKTLQANLVGFGRISPDKAEAALREMGMRPGGFEILEVAKEHWSSLMQCSVTALGATLPYNLERVLYLHRGEINCRWREVSYGDDDFFLAFDK